jgi:hypothetical protein
MAIRFASKTSRFFFTLFIQVLANGPVRVDCLPTLIYTLGSKLMIAWMARVDYGKSTFMDA